MEQDPKTNQYPTETITTILENGTLASEEVVVVPRLMLMRVKFLFGVRAVVIWIANAILTLAEIMVNVTDKVTLRYIPKELLKMENEDK
jgi:hypothetical protein